MPVRSRDAFVALSVLWFCAPLSGPVRAQQPPGAVAVGSGSAHVDDITRQLAARLAGPFRLTSADGERRCDLTLTSEPAGTGLGVQIAEGACPAIAFTAQVTAWVPDSSGSIRLLNAHGGLVAEFTEATGGSYEALREGDGVYFLGPPTASDRLAATPEEVMGDWLLSREAGGAPVCRWTFEETRAAGGRFQIQTGPNCDESLTRFGAATWELSGGNILVRGVSSGTTIRFARQDDGTWARVPEGSRPLLMTRP